MNNRFNQNGNALPVQSYRIDLSAAGDNVSLPISGDWLVVDRLSNGFIKIDLSGDTNSGASGNTGLVTLGPGDILRGPFTRPRAYWLAQARAKAVILYGSGNPPVTVERNPDASFYGGAINSSATPGISFAATNIDVINSFNFVQGSLLELDITATYQIPTVDTLDSLLLFGLYETSTIDRIFPKINNVCVTPTASGWDVVHTLLYSGRVGYYPTLDQSGTIGYTLACYTVNGANITRTGGCRMVWKNSGN